MAEMHPINVATGKSFAFDSRITVNKYSQKLIDVFGVLTFKKFMKKFNKRLKKLFNTGSSIMYLKPKSLEDLPTSSSGTSSSSDVDANRSKGLTNCSLKIGLGASLYLQTMKTLMYLFLILSIINLPVIYMYSNNT